MRLLFVVVLTACSHHDPKPTQPAPEPAASPASAPAVAEEDPAPCDQVVSHALKLTPGPAVAREIMDRHCRADAWSLDVRRCFLSAGTFDQGLGCESKWTPEQMQALADELKTHDITLAKPRPTP